MAALSVAELATIRTCSPRTCSLRHGRHFHRLPAHRGRMATLNPSVTFHLKFLGTMVACWSR